MIRLFLHLFGRTIFLPIGIGVGFGFALMFGTGTHIVRETQMVPVPFEIERSAPTPRPALCPLVCGDDVDMDALLALALTPTLTPVPTPPPPTAVWPLVGPITTYFGEDGHQGLDIAGDGTVVAAFAGHVVLAGWLDAYGIAVVIEGGGTQAIYGHFGKLFVSAGEDVAMGQAIGDADCTGYCTGPHLHFEVRQNGGLVDPLMVLP